MSGQEVGQVFEVIIFSSRATSRVKHLSQKPHRKLGENLMYKEANGRGTNKAPEHPAPYT